MGLLEEAANELILIDPADQSAPVVIRAKIELHMAAKQWDRVIAQAQPLANEYPEFHEAWIAWAYALRELQHVAEALAVLERGLKHHGETHPIFYYNLACYHCLLGDLNPARASLRTACGADEDFKAMAAEDTDLRPLWAELRVSG